ncbi:MAG: RNA polymerase sigma factor [Planctomycetota bacterium]
MADAPTFHENLKLARDGEQAAMDRLFATFYPQVQANVHRQLTVDFRRKHPWIGAMFSTGDVVQDVFLNVLRDIDDFEGGSEAEFAAYLTTLTRNRLIDAVRFHEAVRRDRRKVLHKVDEVIDSRASTPASLVHQDEVRRYAEALASFRERERVLLRSRLENQDQPPSFDQLAQDLGYPTAGAARQAFFKCKARLLLLLEPKTDS